MDTYRIVYTDNSVDRVQAATMKPEGEDPCFLSFCDEDGKQMLGVNLSQVRVIAKEDRPVSRVVRASDGHLGIVVDPGTDDCICPPGLVGTDMACRVHGMAKATDD